MAGNVGIVNVRDVSIFLDQLRAIKSSAETHALKRVSRIGGQALKRTIEWSRQQINGHILNDFNYNYAHNHQHQLFQLHSVFNESHIAARFEFESRISGGKRIAFPSVCASGHRATIIHYGRNDHTIQPIDWILTDVGVEDHDGYCCDISRTWPITTMELVDQSQHQLRLQLYEALIKVQRRLIKSINVGETSLDDLYRLMLSQLTQLLIEFNAFDQSVVLAAAGGANLASLTRKICPHHVSHYIGKA